MGIEVSTYISGLTASWPPSGDLKSQGDDHLRLIKGVLQSTFPNATLAFRFPSLSNISATTTLTVSNQNSVIVLNTSGAAFTVTLPAPGTLFAGWQVTLVKFTGDGNFVNVVGGGGTIYSQTGNPALVRIGQVMQPVTFVTDGGSWFCSKSGGIIGETISFDGPSVPPGFLTLDGSAYDTVAFCELAAMLGTNVLFDKRGRVEAGVDTTFARLGAVIGPSRGSVGGSETLALAVGNIPLHHHGGTTDAMNTNQNHSHTYNDYALLATYGGGAINARFTQAPGTATSSVNLDHTHTFTTSTNPSGLAGSAHSNVQPTIVTQKIIRAC